MKAFAPALLVLLLCGCEKPGVVTGRVVLEGTPPPEREIKFDFATAPYHGTNRVTTRHWLVDENHELANVLVYIKEGVTNHRSAPPPPVDLVITGALYQPYVIAVQTNQPICLTNADALWHTAMVTPPFGSKNKGRSLGMPGGRVIAPAKVPSLSWKEKLWQLLGLRKAPAPPKDLRFSSSDIFVRLTCDVHPWEYGYVAVLEHSFFAITKTNGTFTLPPLPPGRYVVEAIHLKAGTNRQEVVVTSEQTTNLTITMRVPGFSR